MPCRAPRLTGRTLQFVVWLLESAFSGPIWVKSMRDSGIPQAVRDIDLPEPATYKPYWLQRSSSTSKDEVVVEDKPVQERLHLASQGIPGTTPAACFAAQGLSPLCWPLQLCLRLDAAGHEPYRMRSCRLSADNGAASECARHCHKPASLPLQVLRRC